MGPVTTDLESLYVIIMPINTLGSPDLSLHFSPNQENQQT
jgi:hypothetical protein